MTPTRIPLPRQTIMWTEQVTTQGQTTRPLLLKTHSRPPRIDDGRSRAFKVGYIPGGDGQAVD